MSLTEKWTPDLILYDIMTLYQTIPDDPLRITCYRPTDILGLIYSDILGYILYIPRFIVGA